MKNNLERSQEGQPLIADAVWCTVELCYEALTGLENIIENIFTMPNAPSISTLLGLLPWLIWSCSNLQLHSIPREYGARRWPFGAVVRTPLSQFLSWSPGVCLCTSWEAAMLAQHLGSCCTCGQPRLNSWVPTFSLGWNYLLWISGKWISGWKIHSFFLCFFPSVPFNYNEYKLKHFKKKSVMQCVISLEKIKAKN